MDPPSVTHSRGALAVAEMLRKKNMQLTLERDAAYAELRKAYILAALQQHELEQIPQLVQELAGWNAAANLSQIPQMLERTEAACDRLTVISAAPHTEQIIELLGESKGVGQTNIDLYRKVTKDFLDKSDSRDMTAVSNLITRAEGDSRVTNPSQSRWATVDPNRSARERAVGKLEASTQTTTSFPPTSGGDIAQIILGNGENVTTMGSSAAGIQQHRQAKEDLQIDTPEASARPTTGVQGAVQTVRASAISAVATMTVTQTTPTAPHRSSHQKRESTGESEQSSRDTKKSRGASGGHTELLATMSGTPPSYWQNLRRQTSQLGENTVLSYRPSLILPYSPHADNGVQDWRKPSSNRSFNDFTSAMELPSHLQQLLTRHQSPQRSTNAVGDDHMDVETQAEGPIDNLRLLNACTTNRTTSSNHTPETDSSNEKRFIPVSVMDVHRGPAYVDDKSLTIPSMPADPMMSEDEDSEA